MQILRRAVIVSAIALVGLANLAPPQPAVAGPLDDLNEFVAENLESLANQLLEEPNRLVRRRLRALRQIERLAKRYSGADVVSAAARARRVVGVLERSYNCTGPEDEEARQLMDALLADLETDLGLLRDDADLGLDGLMSVGGFAGPGARTAERLLAKADSLAERAAAESRREQRASLVARAARLAGRARKIVRRAGGVTGPYDGVASLTGTAAGTASLLLEGAETVTENVGTLLTTTGRGDLSSLRLEGTFADSVLRVGVPTAALLGLADGALPVGAGVDDVRVELETAAGTVEAVSGTLRFDQIDLRRKTLTATFDAVLPGVTDPVSATFDLVDFLLLR